VTPVTAERDRFGVEKSKGVQGKGMLRRCAPQHDKKLGLDDGS